MEILIMLAPVVLFLGSLLAWRVISEGPGQKTFLHSYTDTWRLNPFNMLFLSCAATIGIICACLGIYGLVLITIPLIATLNISLGLIFVWIAIIQTILVGLLMLDKYQRSNREG